MTAKHSKTNSGGHLLNYVLGRDQATVICAHGMDVELLPTGEDFREQMLFYGGAHRARVKNDTLHFILSPTPQECENFTPDDWQRLAEDFINKMDALSFQRQGRPGKKTQFANSQYLAVLHENTDKPHLHLVVNRFTMDNQVNDDCLLGQKAVKVANAITQERGWKQAAAIGKENKKKIKRDAMMVLRSMATFSVEEYFRRMEEKGYRIHHKEDSTGRLVGYTIRLAGTEYPRYKASDVSRGLTPSRLEKTWGVLHYTHDAMMQQAQTWAKRHHDHTVPVTLNSTDPSVISILSINDKPAGIYYPSPYREEEHDFHNGHILPGNIYTAMREESDLLMVQEGLSDDERHTALIYAVALFVQGACVETSGGGGSGNNDLPHDDDEKDRARRALWAAFRRWGEKIRKGRGTTPTPTRKGGRRR